MEDFNRRYTDGSSMADMTERELLVQYGAYLHKLCGDLSELKIQNAKEHSKLFNKIDEVADGKVSNRLFFWIVGIIIFSMIGLTSFVGTLNTKVTTNSTCLTNLEKTYDREYSHDKKE
ncbi:MAG: hypothetical protein DRI23_08135 [Candidatus Cloacimonadota bacterium]|nr:MAG: hypothetical protein DRI23_08135 [Candidatus Cloacimonadota bacterium]